MDSAGGSACMGVILYRLGADGNCRLCVPGKLPKDSAQAPQSQGVKAESVPPGLLVTKLELLPRCQLHSWETAASQGGNEMPAAGGPRGVSRAGVHPQPLPPALAASPRAQALQRPLRRCPRPKPPAPGDPPPPAPPGPIVPRAWPGKGDGGQG